MRASRYLIATQKETPADAEIISHQMMLRAGMIRKLASGLYSWLPMGLRVLRKVERIVREEMDKSGAQEVLMPAVQPAELWQESGRWEQYGGELLRMNDRHGRDFCFGPTHEEVITDLIRNELKSYKELPANFYQIQTKFRDERRPRFGVMRAREFIMKDAYTFDIDEHGMGNSYEVMYQAYERIFQRLGLEARAVEADSGTIGGSFSHEFHVLADTGEDAIALCPEAGYSANVEKVTLSKPALARPEPGPEMVEIETPGQHTIEDLCRFLSLLPQRTVKTLIVKGQDEGLVALVLRGDHELNSVKAEALPEVANPIRLASASDIRQATGADPGSIGPVGLKITVIADHSAIGLADFVCGANRDERHLSNVNWGRDLPEPRSTDLRQAVDGDPCPVDPTRPIQVRRGIEVGHVFQLGTKYSEALGANYLDSKGQARAMYMGCYGIGVTRIVAAAIEQNHDEHGIIWPDPIAPFDVCIVPISMHKSSQVAETVERLARELSETGFEVLVDDRDERPGVMFSEMDLIGIPHRLVVGERGLKSGTVEYRNRRSGDSSDHPVEELVQVLSEMRQI